MGANATVVDNSARMNAADESGSVTPTARKRARQNSPAVTEASPAVAPAVAPAVQEGGAVAIVGASPVPCITTVLFLHVDEIPAVKATADLAGTPPANVLDLQVRAFGPSGQTSEADDAIPSWMNVTRVAAAVDAHAVEVSLAFAVGRDAMQLENTGGRIVIVTTSSRYASLAVPGFIDVIAPPVLLQHLQSVVP